MALLFSRLVWWFRRRHALFYLDDADNMESPSLRWQYWDEKNKKIRDTLPQPYDVHNVLARFSMLRSYSRREKASKQEWCSHLSRFLSTPDHLQLEWCMSQKLKRRIALTTFSPDIVSTEHEWMSPNIPSASGRKTMNSGPIIDHLHPAWYLRWLSLLVGLVIKDENNAIVILHESCTIYPKMLQCRILPSASGRPLECTARIPLIP